MYSWRDSSDHGLSNQLSVTQTADDWRRSSTVTQESADTGFQQCSGHWKPPHHALFHAAHAVLLLSFLIPNTHRTIVFIHLALAAGTLHCTLWVTKYFVDRNRCGTNGSFTPIIDQFLGRFSASVRPSVWHIRALCHIIKLSHGSRQPHSPIVRGILTPNIVMKYTRELISRDDKFRRVWKIVTDGYRSETVQDRHTVATTTTNLFAADKYISMIDIDINYTTAGCQCWPPVTST